MIGTVSVSSQEEETLRRAAGQIYGYLPPDRRHASRVIALLQELHEGFMAGVGIKPNEPSQNFCDGCEKATKVIRIVR